jgi:putative ABC transport system substrate-binding protein
MLVALIPMSGSAAAPKVARVGILWPGARPVGVDPYFEAFRRGMQELGYVEGTSVIFEHRYGDGHRDRLQEAAGQLVRQPVDVIVAPGTTRARIARDATATLPIVMVAIGDPVETGLVASFARPGGNVTGVTAVSSELAAKRMGLLKEILPTIKRVGVLFNPADLSKPFDLDHSVAAAPALGLTLRPVELRSAAGVDVALTTLAAERVDALVVLPDSLTLSQRGRIAQAAVQRRLPAMYAFHEFADAGGLIAYGPNLRQMWHRAATFVDKILKGVSPASLPVEQPARFELVVNLATAKALGVTIPPSILLRADRVIE